MMVIPDSTIHNVTTKK